MKVPQEILNQFCVFVQHNIDHQNLPIKQEALEHFLKVNRIGWNPLALPALHLIMQNAGLKNIGHGFWDFPEPVDPLIELPPVEQPAPVVPLRAAVRMKNEHPVRDLQRQKPGASGNPSADEWYYNEE